MDYQDLRGWIAAVEELGELERLDGADWDLEMAAITELVLRERRPPPALLFDEIPGYPSGYRVLTGLANTPRRTALTLRMPTDLDSRGLVQAWRQRLGSLEPIPPRVVDRGPILENEARGAAIDLTRFPAPKWHEKDGGRYLGTADVIITRDPETGWANLGTYRVQLHDERTVSIYMSPGKHGLIHRQKHFAQGQPCPVVLSFGHDPLLFLVAAQNVAYGTPELAYAGAIKGAPIEVLEGAATGLPIPAHAEIAIEGAILPDQMRSEGPFGEFTGYYASAARQEYVVRVDRLLYRDQPIIAGSPPGRPPGENTYALCIFRSALIWNDLQKAGVPDVVGVCCHEVGATRMFNVVAIKQRYPGHARQAGLVALGCGPGAYLSRFVVIVDEDIDPFDLEAVMWAVSTRCDPDRDIDVIRRMWSGPLDPIVRPGEKGFSSRAIIDATRPWEWRDEFPPIVEFNADRLSDVRARWGARLGLAGAAPRVPSGAPR
jgi:4-hydroxy-3-polyprenylbenzoate decarboxylase